MAAIYNGSGFVAGYTLSSSTSTISSSTRETASATRATATVTQNVCTAAGSTQDNTTCPSLNPSNKDSDTTKVGVGVGVGIGVPLLAALAAMLFLWSREKKRSREYQRQVAAAGQQPPWGNTPVGYAADNRAQVFHEAPGNAGDYGAAEMQGAQWRREMSGGPVKS